MQHEPFSHILNIHIELKQRYYRIFHVIFLCVNWVSAFANICRTVTAYIVALSRPHLYYASSFSP